MYLILSLKWSEGTYATWWKPNNSGYTPDFDKAGRYTEEQVAENPHYYNDGVATLAVPVEIAGRFCKRVVPIEDVKSIRKELNVSCV